MIPKHKIAEILEKNSIKNIAFHSRLVTPDGAFFITEYIEEYLMEALQKGAKFIISQEPVLNLPDNVQNILVDNVRESLGAAADFLYPLKPKYMVAVTGTNGKTSVVDYFRQACGHLNIKAASIGTMGIFCTDNGLEQKINTEISSDLTTPDVITMHRILNILCKNGVDHVAFEVSSHGLDQLRIAGIKVGVAIFTNFSQDHLDYHGTMEEYKRAKLKLFSQNLKKDGIAILDDKLFADSEIGSFLAHVGFEHKKNNLLIVGEAGDFQLIKIESNLDGQYLEFKYKDQLYNTQFDVVGNFQAANILETLAALTHCNIDISDAVAVLHKIRAVKGRLERITTPAHNYHIFVDYAHKPLALESTLNELKKLCKNRLLVVFGCGGNRDKIKRKIMGEIANKIADIVIVTDDNPRMEDAASIRKQILEGAIAAREIGSRSEAIKYAMSILKTNDILLIAGKGHEDYQIIGKEKFHFDDAEEVRKYL